MITKTEKFVCVQPGSWPLTEGKVYEGKVARNGWTTVQDDSGQLRKCAAFRFKKIEEKQTVATDG